MSQHGEGEVDVAVVGAGIGGAALAHAAANGGARVLLLERQDRHADLVRGEWLAPWGVLEARRLGLTGAFRRGGAWTIRRWKQWDETVDGAVPEWDLASFTEGVDGPWSFRHHRVCHEIVAEAVEGGARVVWGAREIGVEPGDELGVVRWRQGDRIESVRARSIVGATGRVATVGRQIGIDLVRRVHHWGAGLGVSDVAEWPMDTQAVGTEGSVMFFVFPQGDGEARLYLNFATDDRARFCGPTGASAFLAAFGELSALPHAAALGRARVAGPYAAFPSIASWTARPHLRNTVLIGDEAGAIDPVLGTGLSNALRDARLAAEAVLADEPVARRWVPYVRERTARMRRLHIAADLQVLLWAEFGPSARERRRAAWERAAADFRLATPLLANVIAPELLPEYAFHPTLRERLIGRGETDLLCRNELVV